VAAYLTGMHDAVEHSGDWLGCFQEHTAQFLNFAALTQGWKELQAAEAAVQDDPERQFRVQVAQLPVLYAFMMRWNEMREAARAANADWPLPVSIRETCDRFMAVARQKNVTRLNEWQEGFDALLKAVERAGS
jgi:hypothetical protein